MFAPPSAPPPRLFKVLGTFCCRSSKLNLTVCCSTHKHGINQTISLICCETHTHTPRLSMGRRIVFKYERLSGQKKSIFNQMRLPSDPELTTLLTHHRWTKSMSIIQPAVRHQSVKKQVQTAVTQLPNTTALRGGGHQCGSALMEAKFLQVIGEGTAGGDAAR